MASSSPPSSPHSPHSPHSSSSPLVRVSSAQLMRVLEQRCDENRASQFLRLLTQHCFSRCVTEPSSQLTDEQRACLDHCMDDLTATLAYVTQRISE